MHKVGNKGHITRARWGKNSVDWDDLEWQVGRVFTPAAPVNADDLFAGRQSQIGKVLDAINQSGQHVIIYGERGVGKTSLANVLSSRMVSSGKPLISPRVNCDATDTYEELWKKVFSRITRVVQQQDIGFNTETRKDLENIVGTDISGITPDVVCSILSQMSEASVVFVILDEVDRLPKNNICQAVTDTVKMLSDYTIPVTLIMLGVAETVTDLIAEHQSIERCLTQVPMPRMTQDELIEIIEKGTTKLDMTINTKAKNEIARLSQGFPSYTHRLALYATRSAIRSKRKGIRAIEVQKAIKETVDNTEQSLQSDYRRAITSPQANNLYESVLLACALVETDQFGYFKAADVKEPMSSVMRKKYEIPSFAKHLNDFCDPSRGCVLKKEGMKRKYLYRFTSPLMKPFVVMKGILDKRMPNRRSG